MASRAEVWRRRIRRQAAAAQRRDPRDGLLQRVVGAPSADFQAWLDMPLSAAAVLVGLVESPDGPSVLLTERALHLPQHPGQISFPGGRQAATETAEQAALREASEEVGLGFGQAEILGVLPSQLTGSGFQVTPIVGLLAPDFVPVPDPAEVASVFALPLACMRDAGTRRRMLHKRWGTRFVTDEFTYLGHRIWGATATILVDLLEVIDE